MTWEERLEAAKASPMPPIEEIYRHYGYPEDIESMHPGLDDNPKYADIRGFWPINPVSTVADDMSNLNRILDCPVPRDGDRTRFRDKRWRLTIDYDPDYPRALFRVVVKE